MGKKSEYDERKPFKKVAKYYQEQLIKLSDIDYKTITNARAKYVLGTVMRLPSYLQTITLSDMKEWGLLKNVNQKILKIMPV